MDKRSGKLVVISGPSGVGKTTIVREVLARTGVGYSVSATTRNKREGEADGRDYRFVDRPAFERMIDQNQLLEWAEVFGHLYGTPAQPVREAISQGNTIVLDIDVQGAIQVHQMMPDATFILLLPPGEQQLAARLAGRGSEDEESLRKRLSKAREEIALARQSGVYNHCVVNDDLEKAIGQVVSIVNQESSQR